MMHDLLLFTAKYLYLGVGLIALAYWIKVSKQEKIRLVVFGAVAAVVTLLLVKVGAALFYDPRPFVAQHITPLYPHGADNGFPSDHTVLTAFIALTIFSSSRRIGALLLCLSVLIGLSRVTGHIHSPIDILGSLLFAAIGYAAARALTPRIMKRLQTKHQSTSSK